MGIASSFLSDEEAVDFGTASLRDEAGSEFHAFGRSRDLFEQRILALTLYRLTDLALLVATTTSIVNRLAGKSGGDVPEAALMAHLPAIMTPDGGLTQALVGSSLPLGLVAGLQGFHARLAAVRAMTTSYCRFPAELPVKGGVHIEALAAGWRDLALEIRSLIIALGEMKGSEGAQSAVPAPSARYGRTLYLLAACTEGASPCVLPDGTVEIPDLVERRRHRRFNVDWPAYAMIGDRVADVRIIDFSAGGLCMVEVAPVADAGRRSGVVVVEIVGHAKLAGEIVWQAASSTGIKFVHALDPDHSLLAAARGARHA